ncbi:MAG: hypothetical protein C0459_13345 [Chitinophaga sp.]|jgi:Domain of unknown function (DU1801)|nr:hypothetical protein [Chitinophaga sp.]
MTIQQQIKNHLATQPEAKQEEVKALQQLVLKLSPKAKVWFDSGIDDKGKLVANPTIGYGLFTIQYADGRTKEFFQIGISTNATGISVYIMGLKDKTYLPENYAEKIGKAKVTGYCIRFRTLKDINLAVLEEAIQYGLEHSGKA